MDENSSDSDYSDSSKSSSSTTSSSSSSTSNESTEIQVDDDTELARIEKETLCLPKGLFENYEIFKEFFSMTTWESLPNNFQAYLKNKFLPDFKENNKIEQEKTLRMLFNNEITRFQYSPLLDVYKNLEEGNYRPDVLKLRESIEKSKRREQRFQKIERISQLAKYLMISREKLLRSAYDAPPGAALKVDQTINSTSKLNNSVVALRAKKRFYEEIVSIVPQANLSDFSEDESEFIDMVDDVKGDSINQIYSNNETKIIGTMSRRKNNNFVGPSYNVTVLNNNNFKQILMAHKRRKLEEPDRPEFETNDIRLRDVHARTQNSSGYKKANVGRPLGRKSHTKSTKQECLDGTPLNVSETKDLNISQNQISPSVTTQQQALLTNNHISLPSKNNQIKTEILSDNEENKEIKRMQNSTLPTNIIEENSKKRNLTQSYQNYKGSKKMFSVNGAIVPETMQNININIKDKTNSDLVNLSQYGKIKAATISDLEGIDMMHIPIDLAESGNMGILNDLKEKQNENIGPELMQQTHVCFLSLIRDIFCSTPNHRIKLNDLKEKVSCWLSNPIAGLNDWYCLADNWLELIPSVIHFLTGEFLNQPEDFVPYIEYKLNLNIYQWIGAGRDSDQHLLQLCNYWLNRRNEMDSKPLQKFEMAIKKSKEHEEPFVSERPVSPPPPRCPTNWVVQPATPEELEEFRKQERKRFENPHKSFTYRMHGYESTVGPVKGVYTQMLSVAKARGHNTLIQDRPSFVTILTLVRDATARLPNGEGTRADICELLKSSQYISPDAQESVLQTIVSGALDRMHTELDPCVKYDTKRKTWIYLHRNRTEEEFERLHQENQNLTKNKKFSSRKLKSKSTKIMQLKSPAVSLPSVTQNPPINNKIVGGSVINSPNLKLSPTSLQKVSPTIMKLHTKQSSIEVTDAEAAIDAQSSPTILQKPQKTLPTQIIPALISEIKTPKTSIKKTLQTSNTSNPPKSSSITNNQNNQTQTVVPATNKQLTTVMQNTATIVSGNQNQINISVSGKNLPNSMIIGQNQTAFVPQLGQTSGQGFLVPVNNSSEQIKNLSPITSTLISNSPNQKIIKNNQSMNVSRPNVMQTGKNFVRVATATAQGGKSLLNPQIAAANISLQQQKLLSNVSSANVTIQQKNLSSISTMTSGANTKAQIPKGVQIISNTGGIKSNQALTVIQQKQLLQNLISQQQKQQKQQSPINITQNTVVIPSGNINQVAGIQQNKPVIITSPQSGSMQASPQQVHKILTSTTGTALSMTAGTVQNSTNTINSPIVNITNQQSPGSMMNPQIIQIHQTSNPTQIGKVQTLNTLTTQQHQLLQSIKHQQLKLQPNSVSNQQQPIVIKQQPTVFQQIQKSNSTTPTSITVNVDANSPKNVTSLIGTNISNLIATSVGNVIQQQSSQNMLKSQTLIQPSNIVKTINTGNQQQQTITRVIKSGNSIIQPQVISSVDGATVRSQSGNPVMTKVLANSSGQIISLESLLQKQGLAPGTALRVTGAKPAQTNLIQLAGNPGSQITQYAVVSQGRNLISLGNPQRLITTQASNSNSNTVVSSLSGTIVKVNDQKATTSVVNSPTIQNQPKVITTNQIQSLTAQQLVNAKVLSKTGTGTGIRMVNASNLNIAHIRGKPVIIASKPTNVTNPQNTQNVILQNSNNNANIVIGGQTLKVQGNILSPANVQVLNQPSSQPQTVVLGNQILKVQASPQTVKPTGVSSASNIINNNISNIGNSSLNTITTSMANANASGNVVVNSNTNLNQSIPKTVVLGSTGQTIRVQSPQVHVQTGSGTGTTQGQSMILGTAVKSGSSVKSNLQGQQRVVLAVQGGSQILIPPGFQGGTFNLKSLQGLKVVSIGQQQQQQQQNKGQSDEQFRIVTTPQAPRPPNPGGD